MCLNSFTGLFKSELRDLRSHTRHISSPQCEPDEDSQKKVGEESTENNRGCKERRD